MLTESHRKITPNRSSLREEAGWVLLAGLVSSVLGLMLYGLLTVLPYLLDANCSKSGYLPVTFTECLPEPEVRATSWETTIPTPLGDVYLAKGDPIAQEIPLLVLRFFLAFPGVLVLSTAGRAFFWKLERLSTPSRETPDDQ